MEHLARMVDDATPTANSEESERVKNVRVKSLQHFLMEEVKAHLLDCSRPEQHSKSTEPESSSPSLFEPANKDVDLHHEEREKRRLVLRKVVVAAEAKAKLRRFRQQHSETYGLDGSLVGEGWRVEAVEGRAGQSYSDNARPRGKNSLRCPVAKALHADKREAEGAREAAEATLGDSSQEGQHMDSKVGSNVEAEYMCDLCEQRLRSIPVGLLYHRKSAKLGCVRSKKIFSAPRTLTIQDEVASQPAPKLRTKPDRYPRANFVKEAMPGAPQQASEERVVQP